MRDTLGRQAKITVLLPARNAESILPEWLEGVRPIADSVIALDDGSTDRTAEILRSDPMVDHLLTNPVRSSYEGWDDFDNRQRLVHAALAASTDWCLFLDADERLARDDAEALRRFVDAEAQPGFAYGFEVFRMEGGADQFDPRGLWVFRLFAAVDAEGPLRSGKLHFVPVPEALPREKWLPTSIRIQHFGSIDDDHRQARFEKYEQADPACDFQSDYQMLLEAPPVVERWLPREPDLPLLLGTAGRYADRLAEMRSPADEIAITAVVIAQNDAAEIRRSIDALVSQELAEPYEVVLVGSGTDETVAIVRTTYPSVRCIQLPDPALPGEARNAGLWAARGDYVTFPGSHVWLAPGSLAARVEAHDAGGDMVTGAVFNGNETTAGWASYFLDHAAQLPTRPTGPYAGSPGNASYVTADVLGLGGFPEDMRAGEDTVVNNCLYNAGRKTLYRAEAAFHHASPARSLLSLCAHHLKRGKALGQIIRGPRSRWQALRMLPSTVGLPARRIRTIKRRIEDTDAEFRRHYRTSFPFIVGGAVAAACGTWRELAFGRPAAIQRPSDQDALLATGDGPILAIGGRPGEAPSGLLSHGLADQAAHRLATFTRYANHRVPVVAALAPTVTSATITMEEHGERVLHNSQGAIEAYLDAARELGFALILQIQPGNATLASLVERWSYLLREPDVGILFDLRSDVAYRDQATQLASLDVGLWRGKQAGRHPVKNRLLVRGVAASELPESYTGATFLDLREPTTPYPHDVFRAGVAPDVVYQ